MLSEQQLREWEALDVEYHSDEITFQVMAATHYTRHCYSIESSEMCAWLQGLSKKRRRLLTQAKLFQQFTEEKQPADECTFIF